jgi:hypothetical protein
MSQPAGFSRPLTLPRRWMCDYVWFARSVPTVPVHRRMQLAEVVAARAAAGARPSWGAIFAKAYAVVSAAWPPLRRAFLSFPRPRLYEHPISVTAIPIERSFNDEPAVFFAQLRQPECRSLSEIDSRLRHCQSAPLHTVAAYRRLLRVSRLPLPLRRLAWWAGLNVSGRRRARYVGTAGLTTCGGLGAAALHPLSVLTTTLNFGIFCPDGSVDVRLTYDLRVLDGCTVARALADLERVLTHEILTELRYLQALAA